MEGESQGSRVQSLLRSQALAASASSMPHPVDATLHPVPCFLCPHYSCSPEHAAGMAPLWFPTALGSGYHSHPYFTGEENESQSSQSQPASHLDRSPWKAQEPSLRLQSSSVVFPV